MPFRSEAQRKFMYARHPNIAKRWAKEYGNAISMSKAGKSRKKAKRPRSVFDRW